MKRAELTREERRLRRAVRIRLAAVALWALVLILALLCWARL